MCYRSIWALLSPVVVIIVLLLKLFAILLFTFSLLLGMVRNMLNMMLEIWIRWTCRSVMSSHSRLQLRDREKVWTTWTKVQSSSLSPKVKIICFGHLLSLLSVDLSIGWGKASNQRKLVCKLSDALWRCFSLYVPVSRNVKKQYIWICFVCSS